MSDNKERSGSEPQLGGEKALSRAFSRIYTILGEEVTLLLARVNITKNRLGEELPNWLLPDDGLGPTRTADGYVYPNLYHRGRVLQTDANERIDPDINFVESRVPGFVIETMGGESSVIQINAVILTYRIPVVKRVQYIESSVGTEAIDVLDHFDLSGIELTEDDKQSPKEKDFLPVHRAAIIEISRYFVIKQLVGNPVTDRVITLVIEKKNETTHETT